MNCDIKIKSPFTQGLKALKKTINIFKAKIKKALKSAFFICCILLWNNIYSIWAFLPLSNSKRYTLTFVQSFET